MKVRLAKKIMKIMEKSAYARYFDSEYSVKEDSRFFHRFKYLYKKAITRLNKAYDPSANVSLFHAILRNSKECSRCKRFKGEYVGRCTFLHKEVESNDWCCGMYFIKNK